MPYIRPKCPHGTRRERCREVGCGGGAYCKHGTRRDRCREVGCGGGSICEHKRQRYQCVDCGGGSICEHKRQRYQCVDCGGSSICIHDKQRSTCKDCGGSSICIHGIRRCRCRECGGSSICEHDTRRNACSICDPLGHLRQIISCQVRKALKSANQSKDLHSIEYLGIDSVAELWAHLQRQPTYEPWMTIDNIGVHRVGCSQDVWQIDHIIPIKFSGSGENGSITEEDVRIRLHYTNLQPMRAVANVSKGNRRVGV